MYASKIQIRAAVLAVIALGVLIGFSPRSASAFECPQNLYTSCFQQPIVQAPQLTTVRKARHKVAKKHRSVQCETANVYFRLMHGC